MRACLRFSRRPLPLPFVPPPSNVPDEPPQGLVDGLAVVVAEQVKLMLDRRDDLVPAACYFLRGDIRAAAAGVRLGSTLGGQSEVVPLGSDPGFLVTFVTYVLPDQETYHETSRKRIKAFKIQQEH